MASVKVSLIGGGAENGITKTLTAGTWNSLDIDLSLYTSPDKTKIIQIKLEPNVAGTIYVDNIHFYGTATGGGGGGGTFTGGIFASDYSGNLGAGTAKSDKGGTVGFFVDPRLFAVKIFEDGSVCGSACNPGGVFNFYYGIGKPAAPTYDRRLLRRLRQRAGQHHGRCLGLRQGQAEVLGRCRVLGEAELHGPGRRGRCRARPTPPAPTRRAGPRSPRP